MINIQPENALYYNYVGMGINNDLLRSMNTMVNVLMF